MAQSTPPQSTPVQDATPLSTPFSCPRCSTCVEVTKFSREHTLTRWVDGHSACPELGDGPQRVGTGRCETLSGAVRTAFDVGLIDARERAAGT